MNAGQMPAGVDGVLAAVPDVHRGQEPGAGHVQVGQRACGAGGGLIGVGDRRGSDQCPHMRQEPGLEQSGGLGTEPGDPPGRHREPQQRVEYPPRPAYRQEMRARQPRCPSLDSGAVLDPARRDARVRSPQSMVPHPPQVRDCTRCSVTYGRGGGGGTSNT